MACEKCFDECGIINWFFLMIITDSKEESTLNFYRNADYDSSDKMVFIQCIDM